MNQIDYDAARFFLQLIEFLVVGAVSVYVYLSRRSQVTAEALETMRGEIDDRLSQHGERLSSLEASNARAPTHADLSDLHTRVTELARSVHELTGEFKSARGLLQVISDHLMRHERT